MSNDEQDGRLRPSISGQVQARMRPNGQGGRPGTAIPFNVPRALRKRMTRHEVKLWNWLREELAPAGFHFRRQVPIDRYIVDFACLRHWLIIEIDGYQHGLDRQMRADARRSEALAALGYKVLRFWNHELDREKRMVLDTVYNALATTPPRWLRDRNSADAEDPSGPAS